jgi:hypothetical protein
MNFSSTNCQPSIFDFPLSLSSFRSLYFHESIFFGFLSTFIAHEQILYPSFSRSFLSPLFSFREINVMERNTILFLLQFIYNSLIFYFRVSILLLLSSLIKTALRMLPSFPSWRVALKVCLPPKTTTIFYRAQFI